jgi:hypothetical protein
LLVAASVLAFASAAQAQTPLKAELRSAATLLPSPPPDGVFAPTAPAGGVVIGAQAWVCDAAQGFAPLVAVDQTADPVLGVSGDGVHLPLLGGAAAGCGQVVYGGANAYVTQGVLANNAPSSETGVIRIAIDPTTGQVTGTPQIIATSAGLGGNQPTAVAVGPDGNLYVASLKNGDIKRIVGPSTGTLQVVQSVGKSPNGHPMRAMAFVGSDLYLASVDALSVISNAASCTGGCNASVIADGFAGLPHLGLTSDGSSAVYFAVGGSVNQVWRYSPTRKSFALVAGGGADRTGNVAGGFAFVGTKTNLLNLDAAGNLWIGDDPSGGTAIGAGRIWTISAAALATLGGGTTAPDPAIVTVLHGPWTTVIGNFIFTPTFNADGTFTATIASDTTGAVISTDSGAYTLTGPVTPSPLGNPQAHLNLTDAQGVVLFDGDILLERPDQFFSNGGHVDIGNIDANLVVVFTKLTI